MNDQDRPSGHPFWGDIDPEEALDRYEFLVDSVYDGIYQLDDQGRFVGVNRMIVESTGYRREQLIGKHVSLILDDHDIDRIKRDFRQRLTAGQDVSEVAAYDISIETVDGESLICELRITPLIADGVFHGSIGIVRDITARKRRERQIQSELEEIVDRITDGFLGLDTDWNITHINERGLEIIGGKDADLVGKNLWEEFPGVVGTPFERAYRHAMDTQEPMTVEGYYPPLDIWFEDSIYPSETGLSIYFRDITDRKERERELQERRSQLEKYEQLFETITDGVYVLDEARRFVMVNDAFASMSQYSREELDGAPASIVFGDDFDQAEASMLDSNQSTTSPSYDEQIRTSTGEEITVESHFTVLHDADGTDYRVGVARDVTDRKRYERALQESNERLEQFAHAASHDLQEPLRMVSSYLRLLQSRYVDDLDSDAREFIAFAVDGADRMKSMIDGLLEYSRIETHGRPFEEVDLNEVLEDVGVDLQVTIEERGATIAVDNLPHVVGDGTQLRQVFQNLLANAIEYSEGEPEVSVSAERNGDEWVISVRDHGIGIKPEHQQRVFEIFHRLFAVDEHPGSGIGLALCQRIIERHDGEIWVDSTPGEGSTFAFTLPARVQEPTP